jgi:hypothetical protein
MGMAMIGNGLFVRTADRRSLWDEYQELVRAHQTEPQPGCGCLACKAHGKAKRAENDSPQSAEADRKS